jgi:hypothetical protein
VQIKEYPKHLNLLAKNKHVGKLINDRSKAILIQRASDLTNSLSRRGVSNPPWGFYIPRETPFEFVQKDGMQVDVSCIIEGKGKDILKQNFEIRVWSLDEKLSYREGIDSPELRDELQSSNWKRVISRFHFDLRMEKDKEKIPEPICHLQVGGDSGTCVTNGEQDIKENCWHPDKIRVPRFFHLPYDMVMMCEFILVNFFPTETEDLRKRHEWIRLVKDSEELFCRPYFEKYISYFNDNKQTLLGHLISTQIHT